MAVGPIPSGAGATPAPGIRGPAQVASPQSLGLSRSRRPQDPLTADELDPVAALAEMTLPASVQPAALADQLLAFIAPAPVNPSILSPSRLVPLLGAAADLLTRYGSENDDIVRLGSAALEQELRAHAALADRRATLVGD